MTHNQKILTEFAKPTQFKVCKKLNLDKTQGLIHGEKRINCNPIKQPQIIKFHSLSIGIKARHNGDRCLWNVRGNYNKKS